MPRAYIFQEEGKAGSVLHVIFILRLCCSMLYLIFLSKKEKQSEKNQLLEIFQQLRKTERDMRSLGPVKISGIFRC